MGKIHPKKWFFSVVSRYKTIFLDSCCLPAAGCFSFYHF
ncbi:hypothetical protein LEP1GSC012_3466 [Leptospira interrogans serovar Valbuzzi str. Valbuzzi]|nr:hypothetical protein LEP1GSC012_3466 [Leptospira interrogans serovar Valbuzzi str. Valbuzzi]